MNIESYDMQYTLEVLCNSLENKPKGIVKIVPLSKLKKFK